MIARPSRAWTSSWPTFHQIEWPDYLQRMRDGIAAHGPVQEGVYALVDAGEAASTPDDM